MSTTPSARRLAGLHRTALILGTLALLISSHSALADQMTIANPGVQLTVTTTGGGIEVVNGDILAGNGAGTVNGRSVPWMFCVDFARDIYVPGTYNANITHDGTIHGTSVGNARQVTWLVDHYGGQVVGNSELGAALQAAIWKVMYGSQFTLNYFTGVSGSINASLMATYNSWVSASAGQSDSVANLNWISPVNSDGTPAQGQITINTPEPSTFAIAGLSGLGIIGYHLRRRPRT